MTLTFLERQDAAKVLKAQIIYWLGGAYDGAGEFPGNPDYRNEEDVDELVKQLVKILKND